MTSSPIATIAVYGETKPHVIACSVISRTLRAASNSSSRIRDQRRASEPADEVAPTGDFVAVNDASANTSPPARAFEARACCTRATTNVACPAPIRGSCAGTTLLAESVPHDTVAARGGVVASEMTSFAIAVRSSPAVANRTVPFVAAAIAASNERFGAAPMPITWTATPSCLAAAITAASSATSPSVTSTSGAPCSFAVASTRDRSNVGGAFDHSSSLIFCKSRGARRSPVAAPA